MKSYCGDPCCQVRYEFHSHHGEPWRQTVPVETTYVSISLPLSLSHFFHPSLCPSPSVSLPPSPPSLPLSPPCRSPSSCSRTVLREHPVRDRTTRWGAWMGRTAWRSSWKADTLHSRRAQPCWRSVKGYFCVSCVQPETCHPCLINAPLCWKGSHQPMRRSQPDPTARGPGLCPATGLLGLGPLPA